MAVRKHVPHRLEALKRKLLKRNQEQFELILNNSAKRELPKGSFHIYRGYDLRTGLEDKILDTHRFAKWTLFVNRTGTLIHAICRGGDFHVRFPMRPGVGGANDQFIERLMFEKMHDRFVL